jgi:predicted phage terminase large subunit-like protein
VDAKYPDRLAQGNELFDTAIMSRLNAESNILIIQHRLHENDLSAHAARNWQFRKVALALIAPKNKIYELNDGSTWCRKKGSVLRPGQYNTSELKQLRKTSMFYFLQQQDQDKQGEAKILPKHFGTTPGFVPFGKRFISIDAGLKGGPANSYNVAQVWQVVGPHFYLLDQFRAQCSFLDFEPRVCALIKRYKPSAVLIENAANGVVLALRVERRFPSLLVLKVEPGNDSKSKRLARHRTAIQKGIIFLPEDAYWRIEYIEEFISFPGPFTDQVDATTMLLDSIDLLARVNAPQLLGAPYGIRTTTGPISNPAGATFYGPRGEAVVLSSGLKKRFF